MNDIIETTEEEQQESTDAPDDLYRPRVRIAKTDEIGDLPIIGIKDLDGDLSEIIHVAVLIRGKEWLFEIVQVDDIMLRMVNPLDAIKNDAVRQVVATRDTNEKMRLRDEMTHPDKDALAQYNYEADNRVLAEFIKRPAFSLDEAGHLCIVAEKGKRKVSPDVRDGALLAYQQANIPTEVEQAFIDRFQPDVDRREDENTSGE